MNQGLEAVTKLLRKCISIYILHLPGRRKESMPGQALTCGNCLIKALPIPMSILLYNVILTRIDQSGIIESAQPPDKPPNEQ